MNNTLTNLSNSYLEGGTGSIMLYYDFVETGVVGSSPSTGYIKNVSPSSTVGGNNGIVQEAVGTTSEVADQMTLFLSGEITGGNFVSSNVYFEDFSGKGFLDPENFDSEVTFLFSFTKVNNSDGVLFGNLNKFNYADSDVSFSYGKGFNIGLNDRNKLFFQGIDSTIGEYVVTANELELADKNICSATISPYSVIFSYYNLADDQFQQQSLRTDCKIQNNDWGENFYLGGSPTYLRSDETFSGFVDKFMVISGLVPSSDLKSISSGFVATGIISSGQSFQDQNITGHEITLIYPSGITGYRLVPTGTQQIITHSSLIEFVLSVDETNFPVDDGNRFLTGYLLPNGSGAYLEETAFLYPNNDYTPTGDNSFATLGLVASGSQVETSVLTTTRIVSSVSGATLYDLYPLTGLLTGEPTGYSKQFLLETVYKTGTLAENLGFKQGVIEEYKHDYLHYLDRRW